MERLRPGDPEQIGPWQIVNRLGSGGMGVVYMGTNGTRAAAIKVLRDYLLDDPTSRTRLAREVEALERVKGNYAAEIVGADTDSNPAWIATNYVDGPSLKTLVDREGPLNEKQWLEFAYGLMDALASIHSLGVIHRDIKPSNILIAKDGPKLIDFGISLSGDATSLTGTGLVAGTPSWLAPEQFLGRPLTSALDNFSAGSTLVYAATGGNPWDKDDSSVAAVMHSILNNKLDIKKLSNLQKSICEKLLIKDPEQRATAAEIREFIKKQQNATDQDLQKQIEKQRLAELQKQEAARQKELEIQAIENKKKEKELAQLQREQQKRAEKEAKETAKKLKKESAKTKPSATVDSFKELNSLKTKSDSRVFMAKSNRKTRLAVLALASLVLIAGGYVISQQPGSNMTAQQSAGIKDESTLPTFTSYKWEAQVEGEDAPQIGNGQNFEVFLCDQGVFRNSLKLVETKQAEVTETISTSLLRGDSRCGAEFDTILISGKTGITPGETTYELTGNTDSGFNFVYSFNLKLIGVK